MTPGAHAIGYAPGTGAGEWWGPLARVQRLLPVRLRGQARRVPQLALLAPALAGRRAGRRV